MNDRERDMTLTEEMLAAARGCVALLIGQRDAPRYFDFSYRGLAGSAIGLVIALAVNAYLPFLVGMADPEGPPGWQSMITIVVVLAVQMALTLWLLRQMGRLDGFVPYLVASNWTALFITAISATIAIAGFGEMPALLLVAIAVIVLEINIARLIVTLSGTQIVLLLVTQAFGGFLGLVLVGLMLPVPEAAAAAML